MNNTKIILIIVLVLIVGGAFIFLTKPSTRNNLAQQTNVVTNQPVSQTSVSYSLSPSSATHQVNDSFDVAITLDGGSNNIGAVDFNLTFDKEHLTVASFTPSSSFNQTITGGTPDNTNGTLRVVVGNNSKNVVTGNKINIGVVHFKAKAKGNAQVKLTSNDIGARTNPPSDIKGTNAMSTYIIE